MTVILMTSAQVGSANEAPWWAKVSVGLVFVLLGVLLAMADNRDWLGPEAFHGITGHLAYLCLIGGVALCVIGLFGIEFSGS